MKELRLIDLPTSFRFKYKEEAEHWQCNTKSWYHITNIKFVTAGPSYWEISTELFTPLTITVYDLERFEFVNATNLHLEESKKELDDGITKAADEFAKKGCWQCPASFIDGAKSLAAKEYWLEQFRQNNELYIALMLKGMYTEDDVKLMILSAMDYKTDRILTFTEKIKWFDQNKKTYDNKTSLT